VVIRVEFYYNCKEKAGNMPFAEKVDALFRTADDLDRELGNPL